MDEWTPSEMNVELERLKASLEPAPAFDPRLLSNSVGNIMAETIHDYWKKFPDERWLRIARPERAGDIATLRVRLRSLVQRDFPMDELRVVANITRVDTKDYLWIGREKPKRPKVTK